MKQSIKSQIYLTSIPLSEFSIQIHDILYQEDFIISCNRPNLNIERETYNGCNFNFNEPNHNHAYARTVFDTIQ